MAKRHDELNINPPSFCKKLSNMNKEIKVNVKATDPILNGYTFMIIKLIESAHLVPPDSASFFPNMFLPFVKGD